MIFTKMAKILVLATALALAGSSAFAVTAAEGAANLIKVGSDPILFNLKDIKGNDMVLQDQLGKKAILLVFWSLFCGPCQE
ncbi:redoxin domain-containing protein, partial [bacterium]